MTLRRTRTNSTDEKPTSLFDRARDASKGLSEMFSIDARSLALTRMAVGALVLLDVALRAADVRAFYSDAGVMPRGQWLETFRNGWSLYLFSGKPGAITALLVVHALVALAVLVGYRTRTATLLAWILTASLHARNPAILQGGDTLLLLLLFWGIFAPWGACMSVDALASSEEAKPILSAGGVGLMLQMPLVYLSAALQKSGPEWRKNFGAVYYALNDDFISSRLGSMIGSAPMWLLKGLTIATLVAELSIPVLLFSPGNVKRARSLALAIAFALQLGFGLSFRIGLFPLVSTSAMLVFLPSTAWDRVLAIPSLKRVRDRAAAWIASKMDVEPARPSPAWRRKAIEVAGAAFVVTAIWANLSGLDLAGMPTSMRSALGAIHLGQGWKMFIHPSTTHGWYVAVGKTKDGRSVDALNDDAREVHWQKPDHVSESFKNYRWRKYFGNIRDKTLSAQRPAFARYLCNEWNASHAGDRVERMELYFLSQPIDRALVDPETKKMRVFDLSCADREAAPKAKREKQAPLEAKRHHDFESFLAATNDERR